MAGSKTVASLVLVYCNRDDTAQWLLLSTFSRLDAARPDQYEIVDENEPRFPIIARMAGDKPEVIVEEVTQTNKESDNGKEESKGESEEQEIQGGVEQGLSGRNEEVRKEGS